MDTELKAKWVEALRSGDYKQTSHVLHDEQENAYCCLGVLCIVAKKELDGETYPWLDKETGDYSRFVTMNDEEGKSFGQIADYIEANL
jgi:hypothetical protein